MIFIRKKHYTVFFRLEGHVVMRNFLTPLWNEGKQPRKFNSEGCLQLQVDSDNQTFLRKKKLQDKSQPYELSLG